MVAVVLRVVVVVVAVLLLPRHSRRLDNTVCGDLPRKPFAT